MKRGEAKCTGGRHGSENRGEAGEGRGFRTEAGQEDYRIESSKLDFQCYANMCANLTFVLDGVIMPNQIWCRFDEKAPCHRDRELGRFLAQIWEFCKYIIRYKYSNWQHWLHVHNTVFCFFIVTTVLSAESPDGNWNSGHTKMAPGGLVPSPPPWTRALPWQTDQFSALCLLGGLQYPQSLLPSTPSLLQWMVPKCQHVPPGLTQACPYCWGGGGGAAWRALTLDGNTVVQGLAGWLAEVQIILLIMHSGKQLPRTKGIQQTGNGPTFPSTAWHASSLISTSILSNVSLWRLSLGL